MGSTPYDKVAATGESRGRSSRRHARVRRGAAAPGLVSLLPCPDYTITIGGRITTTRQLNCAQVPFYASLVRSSGRVTRFRPVLPAGTQVFFRMHVTVPDQPGRQQVLWALDGPHEMPGFSGSVDVTSGGTSERGTDDGQDLGLGEQLGGQRRVRRRG